MHNPFSHLSVSLVSGLVALNAFLVISYLGLFAVVISYAALSVEAAESVRNDLGKVGALESAYLTKVGDITTIDTKAGGYEKPAVQFFVPKVPAKALNLR